MTKNVLILKKKNMEFLWGQKNINFWRLCKHGKVDTSWHNKQEEKSKQKEKLQKNQHSSMDSVSSVSAIEGTETMKSERGW